MTGVAGSLITLLDAVLVNGYGAKTAAGWTKAFSGTNKAAYRMGSGLGQYYLRVEDAAAGTGGAREARLTMYQTMSDVDTGTNPAPSPGFLFFRKSGTLDATARPWTIVGDDRTFILIGSFDTSTTYTGMYFGQIYSYVPNDQYGVALIARVSENNSNYTPNIETLGRLAGNTVTADGGHYLAKDTTGLVSNVAFDKPCGMSGNDSNLRMIGPFQFPGIADGALILVPIYIRNSESTLVVLRGRLRGIWVNLQANLNSFANAGDTFSGTGDLAGKTFIYGGLSAAVSGGGYYILETSNTVPSN